MPLTIGLGPTDDKCMDDLYRLRHRLLAHWRAFALDTELAAGRSPDGPPLRAARAVMLVEPARRRTLARDWMNVLGRANSPRASVDSHVPIQRERVLAAEDEIRRLVAALGVALPVPARGVAVASLLLRDGAGPVYNPRCRVDLGAAVQAATRFLDPSTALLAPSLV
jgi:hypothetical protein